MATVHKPTGNEPPRIVKKFGEVTNKEMFQVRGDPHWYSNPTIAMEQHNKMKQFIANGGFARKPK